MATCVVLVVERVDLSDSNDIAALYKRHVKMVYRLCFSFLGSAADAEDATQSVFMKLVVAPRSFESVEHEKAWLIVCTQNHCRDVLKSAYRRHAADMPGDVRDENAHAEGNGVLRAILALPDEYKTCVYLRYYEGYCSAEIAHMLGMSASTVRTRLRKARAHQPDRRCLPRGNVLSA